MAELELTSTDLAQVRFVTSRVQDLAMSVRVLHHDTTGLHRTWVRQARERLATRPDPDIRLLLADIAQRSARLARVGIAQLLTELSPRVSLGESAVLQVEGNCLDQKRVPGGRGLLLHPSIFAMPRGVIGLRQPITPTVIYPALGAGNLWAADEIEAEQALDDVVGRTRAQLLRATGTPRSTTELASTLSLSAGTVSEHLALLRRAGLVTSSRDGRAVLYRRTTLADVLLQRSAPGLA
ncbi:ArsR/SmtB family transcription factor [Kytococcus sp. Marseille-QA3725]